MSNFPQAQVEVEWEGGRNPGKFASRCIVKNMGRKAPKKKKRPAVNGGVSWGGKWNRKGGRPEDGWPWGKSHQREQLNRALRT